MGARSSRALLVEGGSGPAAARVESAIDRRIERCMAICGCIFGIGFGGVLAEWNLNVLFE